MLGYEMYELHIAHERREEMLREAEHERLVRLVTENLKKHGSRLFNGKPSDKQPKPSKN